MEDLKHIDIQQTTFDSHVIENTKQKRLLTLDVQPPHQTNSFCAFCG